LKSNLHGSHWRLQVQIHNIKLPLCISANLAVDVVHTTSQMEEYGSEALGSGLLNLHRRLQNSLRKNQTGILDGK
jgi:hypothetical protein